MACSRRLWDKEPRHPEGTIFAKKRYTLCRSVRRQGMSNVSASVLHEWLLYWNTHALIVLGFGKLQAQLEV